MLKQYQSLNNEFFNNLIFEILILKQLIVSTNGITESQLDETVKKCLIILQMQIATDHVLLKIKWNNNSNKQR